MSEVPLHRCDRRRGGGCGGTGQNSAAVDGQNSAAAVGVRGVRGRAADFLSGVSAPCPSLLFYYFGEEIAGACLGPYGGPRGGGGFL